MCPYSPLSGPNLTTSDTKRRILSLRSFEQLSATFVEYQKISGYDIVKSIEHEMSGDLKMGMIVIARCVTERAEYFADVLYHAMKGFGTNDEDLIRVMVLRCEIDMVRLLLAPACAPKIPCGPI